MAPVGVTNRGSAGGLSPAQVTTKDGSQLFRVDAFIDFSDINYLDKNGEVDPATPPKRGHDTCRTHSLKCRQQTTR